MGLDNDWFLDDNPNLGFGVSRGLLPLEKTLTGSQILFSSLLNHASMWCSDRTVFIWLLHKQNILEYYVFLQRVPLTVLCHRWIRTFWFYNLNHQTKLPTFWSKVSYRPSKGSLNFKRTQSCSQFQRLNESVKKRVEAVRLTSPLQSHTGSPHQQKPDHFSCCFDPFYSSLWYFDNRPFFKSAPFFIRPSSATFIQERTHLFPIHCPPSKYIHFISFPLNPPLAWLWQSPNLCYHF